MHYLKKLVFRQATALLVILFVLPPTKAQASFFYWQIMDTMSSSEPGGKHIPNATFLAGPMKISNSHWDCEISVPNGFKSEIGKTRRFQEGVTISCSSKDNPKIKIEEYGACVKFGSKEKAENSGPSVKVSYDGQWYRISAVCSEDKWEAN